MSKYNVTWIDDIDLNVNPCSEIFLKQAKFYYKEDPLAIILWYKTEEKNGYTDFFNILRNPDKILYEKMPSVYLEQSKKIRNYYKNKLMMRRLRGDNLSSFMLSLDKIIDNDRELTEDKFAIVVKIIDFYKEDIETDCILKDVNSLNSKKRGRVQINDSFEFIGSVSRLSRTQRLEKFYFKDSKNNVLTVDVRKNELSFPVFQYLAKRKSKIKFKGHADVHNIVGRDFNCYHLGTDFEIQDEVE